MIKLDPFELLVVIGMFSGNSQFAFSWMDLFFLLQRLIVLQSRPSLASDNLTQSMNASATTSFSTTPCDLHILMGHENT